MVCAAGMPKKLRFWPPFGRVSVHAPAAAASAAAKETATAGEPAQTTDCFIPCRDPSLVFWDAG